VTHRYTDRVVLVTGAAQGLGRAMAERFAAEGGQVVVSDVDASALARLSTVDAAWPCAIDTAVVDVADSEAVTTWVTETARRYGHVDVIVNNAGVIRDNRIENITNQDWDAVVDVSLRGAFHVCRAAIPHMKQRRYGRILSFASMSWHGNYGQANYAAAKAGVVGLARTIALEGARYAITSNVIAPGLIDTPMLASMNDRARAKLSDRVPMNYIGEPRDIAEAAAYLCSEDARYVTGVVLDVDGGITIGSSLR
jgi:3-oxoacyl-[acyl-carrier protein] reductase